MCYFGSSCGYFSIVQQKLRWTKTTISCSHIKGKLFLEGSEITHNAPPHLRYWRYGCFRLCKYLHDFNMFSKKSLKLNTDLFSLDEKSIKYSMFKTFTLVISFVCKYLKCQQGALSSMLFKLIVKYPCMFSKLWISSS